jgi:hypothetical protein
MSVSTEPESSFDSVDLRGRLLDWLKECAQLRAQVLKPDLADGVRDIHKQLLTARRALDRMETHVARLLRLRNRTRQAMLAAKWALEEAEDKAYDSRKLTFGDFTTGREKEAWVSTRTVVEKMNLHKATLLDEEVGAALEEVRVYHRGVDGARRDAETRLRILTFERSLER